MEIREIFNTELKKNIAENILNDLPRWFGIPESTKEYVNSSGNMIFYCCYIEGKPAGFLSIKPHNPYSAELYVLGVLEKYHRKGIGRALVQSCEEYLRKNKIEYLQVKTLDESSKDEAYEKTRKFYLSMGFRPLECFPALWDEYNPCLVMVKYINM